MTERPILFSGEMVRAILEGRKSQTRRVVKPVRGFEHNNVYSPDMVEYPWAVWWHGKLETVGCLQYCPYGKPGDRLWVRETWQKCTGCNGGNGVLFRASCDHLPAHKWKPSIFMPRSACRIRLEITDVRVERVQDISHRDALAEGVKYDVSKVDGAPAPRFRKLWDSINAKPKPILNPETKKVSHYVSCPWEDVQEARAYRGKPWIVVGNPHVWAISFKRIEAINAD